MQEHVIFYARVSTHSIDQLESLKHQIDALNNFMKQQNYPKSTLIKEITSISNRLSTNLSNIILKEENKVDIVVTNFDRLIRDFGGLKFLRENVREIISVNENKTINLETNWKDLLPYITSSVEEIDKLKHRLSQYNNLSTKRKRKRTPEEQIYNSKKRSATISGIIAGNKYNEIVDDISRMIQKSQDLTCKNDWKTVANIAGEYGEPTIMKDYANAIKTQNEGGEIRYTLTRTDVFGYVQRIFKFLHIKVDDYILRNFVNANITLGKKIVEHGDLEVTNYESENIDDIVDILKKISVSNLEGILNQEEMDKIKSITESITNASVPKKKKSKASPE